MPLKTRDTSSKTTTERPTSEAGTTITERETLSDLAIDTGGDGNREHSVVYALDLDEEVLAHLPLTGSWDVFQAEAFSADLIEDPDIRVAYAWQSQHLRDHHQLATAAVLADEFDLDFRSPDTAPGDLLDRLRERYVKNHVRRALREVVEDVYPTEPLAVPQALVRLGREASQLLIPRGEMYGSGDFDRTLRHYERKASAGAGPSFGHPELDEHFNYMKGVTFVLAPPKSYKALALTTAIPTPTGWTTMGALRMGDQVFDENGQSCTVIGKSPIFYQRQCYRVVFSDGTTIVADAEHLWETQTRVPWRKKRIWTTEQIRDSLRCNNDQRCNHAIVTTQPLNCEARSLPIDPYVLGAWLGDGTSADGAITTTDPEILTNIRQAGYRVRKWPSATHIYGILGLRQQLRLAGALDNKHIPIAYRRASIAQRLDLLRGLMDTDGTCTDRGDTVFVTTNARLKHDVLDLIRSLGYKPVASEYRAMLNGRDCGPKWHIRFTPSQDVPVFTLRRKRQRQRIVRSSARSLRRYIVAIEPVDSVPVQCITVNSPNHLYLAGSGMVPTHNSWFCVQCTALNILQGKHVWLIPLEMPAVETNQRLYHLLANVPWWKYTHNKLNDQDKRELREAAEFADSSGVYRMWKPSEGQRNIDEIVHRARDAGADLIIFDQLQYLEYAPERSLGEANDTGKYFGVLNRARNLSDEGAILIAHQFHRNPGGYESMPSVDHAKGSSSIEEVATLCLGMYQNKDMKKSNQMELGTLIARDAEWADWAVDINLTGGCDFTISHRIEDE